MFLDEKRDKIATPFSIFSSLKSKKGCLCFHSNLRISEEKKLLHLKGNFRVKIRRLLSIMGIQTA